MSRPGSEEHEFPGSPQPGSPYPPSPYPPAAPYPPPPPYWASGPPPARRRRSRWLTIGLPLGVLLLGGLVALVALFIGTVGKELGPAQEAAGAYAQALVDQRWDDAHGLLCDQGLAGVTPEDLAGHYAQPELTGFSIDGISVSNVNGQRSAQAEITFTTADGLTDRTSLPLTHDGTRWEPCP
jgi:hypothetical protein